MSKNINLTELDFDSLKSNLKTFLSGQSTFQDYDFDGSGLSILLDVLTYNTHYNAVYNNLSINEMFLDSARKRNNVVSKAKEIGYTPRSAVCAKAVVNVTFTSSSPKQFEILANTPFSATVNGVSYTFFTTSSYSAPSLSTSYTFNNVELLEKSNILSYSYVVSNGQKYIIPNANVDLSTLTVNVFESVNSTNKQTFSSVDTIVDVTNNSNVYWVKEIDDGLYEVTFGNGTIGASLTAGNVVKLDYAISSLDAPNGARLFSYGGTSIAGISVQTPVTVSPAAGGASPEDIDSIKFNAPRSYTAQNRAVTPDDVKAIIYANYPLAESVKVWGGEENIPPAYGKVFVCIKPQGVDALTPLQKSDVISNILKRRKVLTITPELLDPEYIDVALDVSVYYNELETTHTATTIKNLVQTTILNYDSSDLQHFDSILRYSKLSRLIDATESSIINNITTLTLKREVTPIFSSSAQYNINLINPFYYSGVAEDTILSTGFYITGDTKVYYLTDDGAGYIQLFYIDSNNNRIVTDAKKGSVDYAKGTIQINSLNISEIVGSKFILYIKPSSNDVISALTQIVRIDTTDLTINVIADKTLSGNWAGGTNYVFTTSRT